MTTNDQTPATVVSEGAEDISFQLTNVDAVLILDQIVVNISKDTFDVIRLHRTLDVEEFDDEIQAYLDDASICFIVKKGT